MDTIMGRYRNVSILAVAIFIQIVGLAVQVKRRTENQSTRLIRVWTVAAITPLEKNIVRLQTGASEIWHNYIYLRNVRQENRQLQDQIEQLQLEQVRLRQDAEQAHRLQALLGFKEQYIDKTVAAQVIGSSGSEQSRIVYLDKGSTDGIAQDMAVISSQGVVGKVIQVFRHTAQVLLISDQTSGVGTILEQSRLQGVLKGKPSGEIVLDKIMAEEEVKLGDRVLTSGGDQIFPKGLTIGTVANVKKSGEFLLVTVQPAASLNHLEEVLVITKKLERESEVATGTPQRAADILAQRLPSVPDTPPSAKADGQPALTKPSGMAPNAGMQTGAAAQSQAGAVRKLAGAGESTAAAQNRVTSSAAPGGAPKAQGVPQQLTQTGRPALIPAAAPIKTAPAAPSSTKGAISDQAAGKALVQRPAAKATNTSAAKPASDNTPAQAPATGDVPQ
jgi:rod shape-determining protein MreC